MYKIIEIVTVGQLTGDMAAAEREGYKYVGAVANPGDSIVIMHKDLVAENKEQPERFGFENMTRVADLVRKAVISEGAHHKQWYLEEIARIMEVALPEHDEGIPA